MKKTTQTIFAIVLVAISLLLACAANAQKPNRDGLDSTTLDNNVNLNWNRGVATARGSVIPKFPNLNVGSQFTGIGIGEMYGSGGTTWRGFQVGLHLRQLDNGFYWLLFTNATSDQNHPADKIGTIMYQGNDGDFYIESKRGGTSVELGLDASQGIVRLNAPLYINGQQPIVADADRNYRLGQNISITGNSVGNFVTANDVIIDNGSNNSIHAENCLLRNTSGVTATGADHVIGDTSSTGHLTGGGADYSSVEGDANTDCGYGSKTSGVGNKNFVANGVCEGTNNLLGREHKCNLFHDSQIRGSNNILEGNNSSIDGDWIRVYGDNIKVIGSGTPSQPRTFTQAGVYIINQQSTTATSSIMQQPLRPQRFMLLDMAGRRTGQFLIAIPVDK
jgi:hypothetical protein